MGCGRGMLDGGGIEFLAMSSSIFDGIMSSGDVRSPTEPNSFSSCS